MAVPDIPNVVNASANVLAELGRIGLILQALGFVVIFWIVFQVISFIINRKRVKMVYALKEDVGRIEKKIDRLLSKRK